MSAKKRSRASSIASSEMHSNHHSPSSSHMGASGGVGASSSRGASALPASGPLVHASQDLDDFQASFWRYQMDLVEQGGDADGNVVDFKSGLPTQGQLPLARIKKVMKADDQVKMISAEAPILFARACEIFISDLTCRAFLIAEEHKRRTIQRSDIAGAIGRSDLFDFLIDIVPRHESVPSSRLPGGGAAKREKTGEGKGVGRASASRRPQQHQPPSQLQHSQDAGSYDDSVLHAVSGAYADAEGAASDSLNIPHTAGASAPLDAAASSSSMAHWIHDTSSADEHSSQPDVGSHAHHSHHSHHHASSQSHPQHGTHSPHELHHHPHPHHPALSHAGHHSHHHHSPLDYVASNAGTPNSIGAGSANGSAWSHTFSGFS